MVDLILKTLVGQFTLVFAFVALLAPDLAAGQNLILNNGAEAPVMDGQFLAWTEAEGDWVQASEVTPREGNYHFFAGHSAYGELYQDVDVGIFADYIDAGIQRFEFLGYVQSYPQQPTDAAQIIVEFRDLQDNVLDSFDSGEIAETGGWTEVAETRTAPAGTRKVRIRLISVRYQGSQNDGYFDDLSFKAVEGTEGNYVLRFDGHDDVVNVGIREALQLQELTLEAWVRPTALSNYATILTNTATSSWEDGYGLAHYTTGNNVTFFVGEWDRHKVTGALNGLGVWTHVAATYDGAEMRLYIDGELVDSGTFDGEIPYESPAFQIGNGAGGYPWEGDLEEIRVWDRARTRDEIRSGMYGGLQGNEEGLTAYWTFDAGAGMFADDVSGNGNMGLVDGAQFVLSSVPTSSETTLRLSDNGECTAETIEFNWDAVSGATHYRLDIADAPEAASIVASEEVEGGTTSHTYHTAPLSDEVTYFGRVAASTDGAASYSHVSPFTDGIFVDRSPPATVAPELVLVNDGDRVRVRLTAENGAEVTNHHLQVSEDEGFNTTFIDRDLDGATTFRFDAEIGHTYHARFYAEDCAGNRSAYSDAAAINVPHRPDLVATGVAAPGSAHSGREIDVSWRVENRGGVSTTTNWYDRIYLSDDPGFETSTSTEIGSEKNLSYLGAGESYAREASVQLPDGIQGTYYIHVETASESQPEVDEDNNVARSAPVEIELAPYADLQVSSIEASTNVFSGDSIDVMWTVENQGTAPAEVGTWFDTIFLSGDDELTYNFTRSDGTIRISESVLGRIERSELLAPGASYTASARVKLPNDAVGAKHVIVYTDVDGGKKQPQVGRIYEHTQELNNWSVRPIEITLTPPPDLAVTHVQAPAEIRSGERVEVTWTVANEGPGATREERWSDAVYLSDQPAFSPQEADLLGTFSHRGKLDSDASYEASGEVKIPDGLHGAMHLFVEADRSGSVFEHTFTSNNLQDDPRTVSVSRAPYPDLQVSDVRLARNAATAGEEVIITYSITNAGNGAADARRDTVYVSSSAEWDRTKAAAVEAVSTDELISAGSSHSQTAAVALPDTLEGSYYIYLTADAGDVAFEYPDNIGNTARSGPLAIAAYPPVDLEAAWLNAPSSSRSGEDVTLELSIENIGDAGTREASWTDAVYLSRDQTIDRSSDVELAAFDRKSALSSAQMYANSVDVELPDGLSGTFYLIAEADTAKQVLEVDTLNNDSVHRIDLQLTPPSDLRVTAVNVPPTLLAGSTAMIRWTTENRGDNPAAQDSWYDAVVLSRDAAWSKDDVMLGAVAHEGGLEAGALYEQSLEATLPSYGAGDYFIIVRTDERDELYEHRAEANNTTASAIGLELAPPSDLVVTDVSIPQNAIPGEETTVSWTLTNDGDNPASGDIREAVFISSDSEWDTDDALLGVSEREIDLAPGAAAKHQFKANLARAYRVNTDGEVTGTMPGVSSGAYHAIVRTNMTGAVRETNEQNNSLPSEGTVTASIPELAIGSSVDFSLGDGEARYYRVAVPSGGDDLAFTLDGPDAASGSASLYVRQGEVPSSRDFDAASIEPFELDQEVLLTASGAGAYYVLVEADGVSEGAGKKAGFTLSVQRLDFMVDSVDPAIGGNTGVVTVSITGAQFEDGGRLFLRDDSGRMLEAGQTYVHDRLSAKARFVLTGESTGLRDVVFQNPDGSETVLAGGFQVVQGTEPDLEISMAYPSAVRSEQTVEIEVTIKNHGTVNAMDHFLLLGARIQLPPIGGGVGGAVGGNKRAMVDPLVLNTDYPRPIELDVDEESLPYHHRTGPRSAVLPFWFYEIPAQTEMKFTVFVEHKLGAGSIEHGAQFVPMPESEFTRTGSPHDIDSSHGYQMLLAALEGGFNEAVGSGSVSKRSGPFDHDVGGSDPERGLRDMISNFAGIPKNELIGGALGGAAGYFLVGALMVNPATATLALGVGLGAMVGATIGAMMDAHGTKEALEDDAENLINNNLFGSTDVRQSSDPNDIIGPAGYGPQGWVAAAEPLAYKIRFENDPVQASAPAQVVEITHPIDQTADLRTFRLGSFGFGQFEFDPPPNVASYRERLDVTDTLGVYVEVSAGLDVVNRRAFWIFRSIDPLTGTPPANDPDAGFLPVNDSTGVGEGFANYRISAPESTPTGDTLRAEADIVFDVNAPIATPPVRNSVDANPPVSRVSVVPSRTDTVAFHVSWEGSDEGSGVREFALYASVDGGPWELSESALRDTSMLFVGEIGHTYRFFTLATDNTGNTEPMKSSGEGTVKVSTEDPGPAGLPKSFALHHNYPNPFNPTTTVPFDLARSGEVSVRVYNVIGQQVLTIDKGILKAGTYQQRVDMSRFASGVYFYEIRVLSDGDVAFRDARKFVLLK